MRNPATPRYFQTKDQHLRAKGMDAFAGRVLLPVAVQFPIGGLLRLRVPAPTGSEQRVRFARLILVQFRGAAALNALENEAQRLRRPAF